MRYFRLDGIRPVEVSKKEHTDWYEKVEAKFLIVDYHKVERRYKKKRMSFQVETRFTGISGESGKYPPLFYTVVEPKIINSEPCRTWAEAKYVHHETVKEMDRNWHNILHFYKNN